MIFTFLAVATLANVGMIMSEAEGAKTPDADGVGTADTDGEETPEADDDKMESTWRKNP